MASSSFKDTSAPRLQSWLRGLYEKVLGGIARHPWLVMGAVALFVVVALPALPSLQLTAVSTEALRAPQGDAMVSLPDTWWTSALVVLAAWVVWASVHLVRFAAAIATVRRARAHSHPFPLNVESKLSHWVRVSSTRRRATLVV